MPYDDSPYVPLSLAKLKPPYVPLSLAKLNPWTLSAVSWLDDKNTNRPGTQTRVTRIDGVGLIYCAVRNLRSDFKSDCDFSKFLVFLR